MIIPISHESSTVRRTPFITYLIVVICAAVFVHTQQEQGRARLRIQQTLVDLAAELVERPWVEIDPRVREVFGVELAELKIRARAEAARGGRPLPAIRVPDSIRARHQREFDRKQERLLAALRTHPFFRYGFVADHPEASRLVTYAFVHAGWLHLLGNLLLLYLTAPFVEDRYGRGLFTAFYLLSGAAAALFFAFRHPGLETPLVGASGAVAGCMGAFLVRFFTTPIRFFYWVGFLMGTFRAPAWLMLPLWVAGEWFMGRAMDQAVPGGAGGVAHWAHVGGFGFGALFALGMRGLRVEERFIHPAIEEKLTVAGNPVSEEAGRAREEGRTAEALELLRDALHHRPWDEDVAAALLDTAAKAGRVPEVVPLLTRFLGEMLRRGRREAAVERFAELSDCDPGIALPPALALRIAPVLRDAGRPGLATETLRRALAAAGSDVPPAVVLRLAEALRDGDAEAALAGVERALSRPDLEAAEREPLEALRDALRAKGVRPGSAGSARGGDPARAGDLNTELEVPSAEVRPGMGSAIRTLELPEEEGEDVPEIELDDEDFREDPFGPPGEVDGARAPEPAEPDRSAAGREEGGPEEIGLGEGREDLISDELFLETLGNSGTFPDMPQRLAAAPEDEAGPELPSVRTLDLGGSEDAPALDLGSPGEGFPDAAEQELVGQVLDPGVDTGSTGAGLRPLRVREAVPRRLLVDGLVLETPDRGKGRLSFGEIEAVAAGAVEGLAERPVIVVDLVLNWSRGDEPLRVVRLLSHRFDPRRLAPEAGSPLESLRQGLARILDASDALPLPDPRSARGIPFGRHPDLATYEREVLGAASEA